VRFNQYKLKIIIQLTVPLNVPQNNFQQKQRDEICELSYLSSLLTKLEDWCGPCRAGIKQEVLNITCKIQYIFIPLLSRRKYEIPSIFPSSPVPN